MLSHWAEVLLDLAPVRNANLSPADKSQTQSSQVSPKPPLPSSQVALVFHFT
jgi:hypothetical protein